MLVVLSGEILLLKLDIKDEQADTLYYKHLAESEQAKRVTIEKNRNAVLEYVKRLEQIRKKLEKAKVQIQQAPTVGGKVNDAEPVEDDLITVHNDLIDFFTSGGTVDLGMQPSTNSPKSSGAGSVPESRTGATSKDGAK
jgi:hypothetical protein